jgi:hypothetical protein
VFAVVYILYTCLRGSVVGEADKIRIFFKKSLYSSVNRRTLGPRGGRRRGTNEHGANMPPWSAWAYVVYVYRLGGTDERKSLKFVSFV